MTPSDLPFVCVVGIDGAGKTTTLDELAKLRGDIQTISWKHHSHLFREMSESSESPQEFILRAPSQVRIASISDAMTRMIYNDVFHALRRGAIPIVDSYWYKMVLKLKLLGLIEDSSLDLFRSFVAPRAVILFETSPEVAFSRKREFTALEAPGNADGFVAFQTKLASALSEELNGKIALRIDTETISPRLAAERLSVFVR